MADYGGSSCHKCGDWASYDSTHSCDPIKLKAVKERGEKIRKKLTFLVKTSNYKRALIIEAQIKKLAQRVKKLRDLAYVQTDNYIAKGE